MYSYLAALPATASYRIRWQGVNWKAGEHKYDEHALYAARDDEGCSEIKAICLQILVPPDSISRFRPSDGEIIHF